MNTWDRRRESIENPFLFFLSSSIPIVFDCGREHSPLRALVARITSIHKSSSGDQVFGVSGGLGGRVTLNAANQSIQWELDHPERSPGILQFVDEQATRFLARFYRLFSDRLRSFEPPGRLAVLIPPGFSMIAQHLPGPDQPLSSLLPRPPEGTTIYRFNPASKIFQSNTVRSGEWENPQERLKLGEGVFLMNPTAKPTGLTFNRPRSLPRANGREASGLNGLASSADLTSRAAGLLFDRELSDPDWSRSSAPHPSAAHRFRLAEPADEPT